MPLNICGCWRSARSIWRLGRAVIFTAKAKSPTAASLSPPATSSCIPKAEAGKKSHGHYQRGALLGELAMIAPGRRPCHATATTESEAIRISRAAFMRVLGEYPDVARSLHRKVAADLQGLVEKVGRLGPSFLD